MGKNHVEDCKELLGYMGIPYVAAPCEVRTLIQGDNQGS